ncbi:MAG: hypothetical protein HC916_01935 [Coleofasciculaceae cyanobacterium SM2_1_6]|nr:hypothetical protein [Coleofasciculaceae cyanobacterium SM2_1_6]
MITKSLQRMMKVAAVTLPLMSFGAQSALADIRDFTVVNDSGLVITHLYVSPTSQTTWGPDILGRDVLPPGESTEIVFPEAEPGVCNYDIKVTGEGDTTAELTDIDLCTVTTVTFN